MLAIPLFTSCESHGSNSAGGGEVYGVMVPSDDEATQEAATQINDKNADIEFDKLKREIEDDAKTDG